MFMEKLNEYNQILDAICMYMHDSIVETDDKVISVFEFVRIMNKYIYPFTELRDNNKYIVNEMNKNIKTSIDKSDYSTEKKKYLKHFSIDSFDLIPTKQTTYMDIYMHRTRGLKKSHYYLTRVVNNDKDEIQVLSCAPYYTKNESNIKLIVSFCDEHLKDVLQFSEKYRVFITELLKRVKITNELFDVNLLYNGYGFTTSIDPNFDVIDINVFYSKYHEEKSLPCLIQENYDLLLWSIPIKRSSLPDFANELISKELDLEKTLKRTK